MLFFTEVISQNMQLKFRLNVMSNPGKICILFAAEKSYDITLSFKVEVNC